MKKLLRIIISSFFWLFLSFTETQAQKEAFSFSIDILTWVSRLDKQIDKYFDKQRADQLDRKVQYLKSDLQSYLIIRKGFIQVLEQRNYDISNHDAVLDSVLSKLKIGLNNITGRIRDIQPLVDNILSQDAQNIIDDIWAPFDMKRDYLNAIAGYIEGPVDKKGLKNRGRRIHKNLQKSVNLLSKIQERVRQKIAS